MMLCILCSDGGERRNEGGQILFIEFCDWAIKKQLGSQADAGVATPRAKGGEAGNPRRVSPVPTQMKTPSSSARSTMPRSAPRDRPTRATPCAVSKSQENICGVIEKHSDYRCCDVFCWD